MHLYNIFESSSFEPETIEYKGWRYVPELLVGDDVTKKVHHVFDPSGTELLSPENPFDNADSKLYGPYGAWATEQDFQKFVDSKHTEPAAQIDKPEPEVDEEFANEPGHFDVELKPVRAKKSQAFDETKPVEAYGFIEEDGERKYWSREFPNYAALHLWSRRNRADVAGISNKSDTGVPAANEYVIYVDGQKKFTCATEKEAEQKLLRVKHKYPDKEFEIRQRSMVLTSALREAARVGNTYSDDVPGRTGVGISSNGGVSEAKKKTSADKSNTQTKQELCPSCSSADVKTYSSGEKECNQCHKTWAVKDVSENCDDFHCKLRQKVKQRAASDQADMAIAQAKDPSKWLWKPGDQVYSKKTGKTYSIIGRTLDRKHGAMYLYQHGEEGSDDYEQGRFIADKAHNSLVKINDQAVAEAKPVAQTIDYAVWSKKSPDDQRFLKQLHPKLKIKNVPPPPRPEKPKKVKPDLWKIALKAENVWGNIFPDGDPVDYMYPYLKSLGIPVEKQFDVLNKAIKLHVDKKGYYHWLEASWDNVAKDRQMPDIVRLDNNPWRTEESVAEGNRVKTASGDYTNPHTGVTYSKPTGQDGHDSYMTPEYLIKKYRERLSQIESGPHQYPKEVARLKAKIAKLSKQGVVEGRDATDAEHKKAMDTLFKRPDVVAMSRSLKRRDQDAEYDAKQKQEFQKRLSKKKGVAEGSKKRKDPVEKVGAYWYNWAHGTGPWPSESDARTKSKPHKPEDTHAPDDPAGVRSEGVMENAEELDAGDDVVITGRNNVYQGKTGYIVDFGQDKRFVIVQLYNHGRHSFHSSDVSRNEYADSEEEHDEWNNLKEAGETRHVLYLNGKAVSHYATPNEARQQAALVLKKFPNTQVDIRSAQTGLAEERVRLDARCWRGKKIGNPKTKLKGGVRVNNCVPK